jgi:hypothetical protein
MAHRQLLVSLLAVVGLVAGCDGTATENFSCACSLYDSVSLSTQNLQLSYCGDADNFNAANVWAQNECLDGLSGDFSCQCTCSPLETECDEPSAG